MIEARVKEGPRLLVAEAIWLAREAALVLAREAARLLPAEAARLAREAA